MNSLKAIACLSATAFMVQLPLSAPAKDPWPGTMVPLSMGVAAHYNTPKYNPAYNDTTFNRLARANFRLARFVPDWQYVEKVKSQYDFTDVDNLVNAFTRRGIRLVLTLGLNNPLYGVHSRINTDVKRLAFGNYVRAMVRHYKGRKIIWEVWNEPNISAFWRPKTNETLYYKDAVTEYLAMLDVVAPIVHQEDPEALLIGPGAANFNTVWLQESLARGLMSRLDGLSVHPYQGAERPELVIKQRDQVRLWTPVTDRNKPILFTEWGYSTARNTSSTEVSEETQAKFAQRQYMLSLLLGVRGNYIYSLTNASIYNPCMTSNACYGLFTKDQGLPKPALLALEKLSQDLDGYTFTQRIPRSVPTVYLLKFVNHAGKVRYALWDSQTKTSVSVVLPNKRRVAATETVQVFDE